MMKTIRFSLLTIILVFACWIAASGQLNCSGGLLNCVTTVANTIYKGNGTGFVASSMTDDGTTVTNTGTFRSGNGGYTLAANVGLTSDGSNTYVLTPISTQIFLGRNGANWASVSATDFTMTGNVVATGGTTSATYSTTTNCADSAGAAACGSAAAGAFVIDAATTQTVVSTTAVTANSEIFTQEDSSLNTRLSVTCNTQSSLVLGALRVTARTAGASFTVDLEAAPTTNPACITYHIVN